jgi:tryptophan-rich sensory protein
MYKRIFIFCATIITILVAYSNRIRVDESVRPLLQPKNVLFGLMWATIFSLLVISSVLTLQKKEKMMDFTLMYEIITVLSLLFSAAWVLLSGSKLAVYVIHVSMILACISTFVSENNWTTISTSLLCGWLIIASCLNTSYHLKRYYDRDDIIIRAVPYVILHVLITCAHFYLKNDTIATSLLVPFIAAALLSRYLISAGALAISPTIIFGFWMGYLYKCS